MCVKVKVEEGGLIVVFTVRERSRGKLYRMHDSVQQYNIVYSIVSYRIVSCIYV
jgi:hypothetical protein